MRAVSGEGTLELALVMAMRPPEVSVIIPTYNRGRVIVDAIGSVLSQSFQDFEVIVVDDGSTDDTQARVRSIKDARVRYIPGAHAGVSAARNTGVRHASGALLAFLDSDDLWKPKKLDRDVTFLSRHPDAAAVFADADKYAGATYVPSFIQETPVFARRFAWATDPRGIELPVRDLFLCLLEEVPIVTIAFTVRRAVYDTLGGFDESWRSFEDWHFFLRLARQHCFGYLPVSLATIRISTDSLHLLESVHGLAAMAEFLDAERSRLNGDGAAAAAATRGMVRLFRRLAWAHAIAGRPAAAIRTSASGYWRTRDSGLLLRIGLFALPASTLRRLQSLRNRSRRQAEHRSK